MVIPKWINQKISARDIEQINLKIVEIEQRTSIELVPMIVRRSSTVGHVVTILYLLLCLCTLIASFILYLIAEVEIPSLISFEILFVILNWFLASWLSKKSFFQRLLTTVDDRVHQVSKRAEIEFLENRLTLLPNQNAVLLMISLMERQVQIIVGDSILKKVPLDEFEQVVKLVAQTLRQDGFADAFIGGMDRVCELLQKDFHRSTPNDPNDFVDCLIIKE